MAKNINKEELTKFVNKLLNDSFAGWSEDAIDGYHTALHTINEKFGSRTLIKKKHGAK